MRNEYADQHARQFISSLDPLNAKFYTNGEWYLPADNSDGIGWNGMTNSTFDGGIIAIEGRFAFCIWFQDED